jgi:hypothetical protein
MMTSSPRLFCNNYLADVRSQALFMCRDFYFGEGIILCPLAEHSEGQLIDIAKYLIGN